MQNARKLIGRYVGKYQLTGYLGFGPVAHVYTTVDPQTKREMVIKLLSIQCTLDSDFHARFKRELAHISELRHPHIVRVHGFGLHGSVPYIVTEMIDGPTLKSLLAATQKRFVRVPVRISVQIINSVGEALAYAHNRKLSHGDLKPGNILLEKTSRIVVSDFGMARMADEDDCRTNNPIYGAPQNGFPAIGLPASPEVLDDIYSLGAIFYQLTTGHLPYVVQNQSATGSLTYDIPLPAPRLLVPEIPEQTERVILRAMAKNPADRFQSVEEMLYELSKFADKIKTTMLPSARLDDVEHISGRFPTAVAPDSVDPGAESKISLHFLDTGQIINLETGREYTIGRQYQEQAIVPDIDLTPFKGFEWGISRLHAKLDVTDEMVTITDLGSSNGTYHAGKRIPPNIPYVLGHGDIVFLGKLRIQVLIYL